MHQLNFINGLRLPPKAKRSTKLILYAWLAFLLLLASYSLLTWSSVKATQQRVQTAEQNKSKVLQSFKKIKQHYTDRLVLKKQLAEKTAQHDQLLKQYQVKQTLALRTEGYARYLQALSQSILPEVWLTEFSFDLSTNKASIKGNATSLEALTQFATRLGNHPVFQAYHLSLRFQSAQEKQQPNLVRFEIENGV